MNQMKRIHSYVASLREESKLNEKQESMLLLSDLDVIGGDNKGKDGWYNYVAGSCARQTNEKCSNYGVCDNAVNTGGCHNYLEPPATQNIVAASCSS